MTQAQDETQDTQNIQDNQPASEQEFFTQLAMAAESLLFVSGRPLTYIELRKLLDVHDTHLTRILDILAGQLESQHRGIRLQRLEGQVQLVTAVLVALCGGAGAIARFAVDATVEGGWLGEFPWGTLVVNLSGTFVLGQS